MIDFRPSEQSSAATGRVASFVKRHIEPAEAVYAAQRRELARSGDPHGVPPVLELLKDAARAEGLWNLFLPAVSGLSPSVPPRPGAALVGALPELERLIEQMSKALVPATTGQAPLTSPPAWPGSPRC